jgi:hypothetical protein
MFVVTNVAMCGTLGVVNVQLFAVGICAAENYFKLLDTFLFFGPCIFNDKEK